MLSAQPPNRHFAAREQTSQSVCRRSFYRACLTSTWIWETFQGTQKHQPSCTGRQECFRNVKESSSYLPQQQPHNCTYSWLPSSLFVSDLSRHWPIFKPYRLDRDLFDVNLENMNRSYAALAVWILIRSKPDRKSQHNKIWRFLKFCCFTFWLHTVCIQLVLKGTIIIIHGQTQYISLSLLLYIWVKPQ